MAPAASRATGHMASSTPLGAVVVRGDREVTLPLTPRSLREFEQRTQRVAVECSTGDRDVGEWRGPRVDSLLECAGPPGDATHLLVSGADGYRVCVPLADALDAMLAVARLDADADASLPRFVGTSVSGTRAVQRVRRLETVALAPGEDAARRERLSPATSPSPERPAE